MYGFSFRDSKDKSYVCLEIGILVRFFKLYSRLFFSKFMVLRNRDIRIRIYIYFRIFLK